METKELIERQPKNPETGQDIPLSRARMEAAEYYLKRNISYRRGNSSDATTLDDVADAFNVPSSTVKYWCQRDKWRDHLEEAQPAGMARKPSSGLSDQIESEVSPLVVRQRMRNICTDTMQMLENLVLVGERLSADLLAGGAALTGLSMGHKLELMKLASKLIAQELPALYKALGVTPTPEDDRSSTHQQMMEQMAHVLIDDYKKQDTALRQLAKKLIEAGAMPADRADEVAASIRVLENAQPLPPGGVQDAGPDPDPEDPSG